MASEITGILINKINPLSDPQRILKKDDVILAIDGVLIGNDGTGNISLTFQYYLSFMDFVNWFMTVICYYLLLIKL